MNRIQLKDMVNIAMFTAVLAVLSIIQIPMPSGIPVTLQTFAVALCGYTLGWKKGAATTAVYLLVGLVGFPVFSGMQGGLGVLSGPAGGFLLGFPVTAALCGIGMESNHKAICIMMGAAGLAFCHITGTVQFALVTGRPFAEAFLLASVPYLVKDLISSIGAAVLGRILKKALLRAQIY